MAQSSNFEIIAPEDIRTEKMSFKDMLIRCLDRVHVLASQMAEKGTRGSIDGYEESIAAIHCFVAPYYGTKYCEDARTLEAALNEDRGMKDIERLMKLRQWLALITRNFGKIGILPPVDVVYDMSTPEQKMEAEKKEFLRIMRKFIKLGKSKELVEWFRKGGKLERERIVIERPKIEDILDASYLGNEDA